MTALPHMPMYWERFFADTARLTIEQRGIYALMLGRMWLNGGWLPADDTVLARMLGLDVRAWKTRYKSALLPYFLKEIDPLLSDIYRQKRLVAELAKAAEVVEKNKARTAAATAERLKKSKNGAHVTSPDPKQRNVERNEPRNVVPRARVPEPETETSPIGAVSGSPLPPPADDDASVARDLGIAPPASHQPAKQPAPTKMSDTWDVERRFEGLKPVGETQFLKAYREAGGDMSKLPTKQGAPLTIRELAEETLWERTNARFKPQGPPPVRDPHEAAKHRRQAQADGTNQEEKRNGPDDDEIRDFLKF